MYYFVIPQILSMIKFYLPTIYQQMTHARKLFLLLLCLAVGQVLVAQTTYTTIAGGDSGGSYVFTDPSNWLNGQAPPNPIPADATVEIKHLSYLRASDGNWTNNGTINVSNGGQFFITNVLDNYGTIDIAVNSSLTINTGTVNNKSGGIVRGNYLATWNSAAVNNEAGGLIELDATLNITAQGTNVLNNAGTIITNGSFTCRGPYTGAAGSSLILNGSQSSFYNTFMNGGAIKLAGGNFSAGVGGVFTALAGSSVEWILSTSPGAGSPRINYSGGAGDFTLSTFTVSLASGFEPSNGDAYTIFSGSSRPTNTVSLPALSGGKTWTDNSTTSQMIFEVETPVVGPVTYTTVASGFWDTPGTWDGNGVPPNPIPADATVNVNHYTLVTTSKTNDGTINVNGVGVLVQLQGSITFTNNGDINLNGTTGSGGVSGMNTLSGAIVNNYGSFVINNSSRLGMNNSVFNNKSGGVVQTTNFNAIINQAGGNHTFNNEAGATLQGTGRFEQRGSSTNNVLNNEGTINNNGGIDISNTFDNKAGGVLNNDGYLRLFGNSLLTNSGEINLLSSYIQAGGGFTSIAGSSIEWILSTQPSGNNYPYLNIVSGATVDFAASTFAVNLANGFEPNVGSTYDIYRGSPVPTNAISLPTLTGGNTWKESRPPDVTDLIRLEVKDESCEPTAITCPSNKVVNNDAGDCGATVAFSVGQDATATPASGTTFSLGTTTVNVLGSDGCEGTSSCSFTVTVNDTEAPKFSNCPSNITVNNDTGDCGAEVSWTAPTISDNCTGATSSATDDPGDFFAVGTTTVTYSGSDAADNDAVDCSFTVTVNDTEKPSLSCASNTTVGTDAGECGADVTIPSPNASDNCGVVELKARYRSVDEDGDAMSSWSSRVTDPSDYFPVGRYQIQWRAKDAAGNKRTCSYFLEVEDDEDPTAVCKNVTVDFNGQSDVNLSVSQVWNESASDDNCGTLHYVGTSPSLSISCEDVGNSFPLTVTIRDEAGNKDQCTATVNVIGLACGWSEGANDGSLNCGSNTSATYDPIDESFDLTANGCWHDCLAPDKAAHIYQLLCGDGQLTARLASINSKGYAGLMARESLDPESRRAGVLKNNSTRRVRREYRASNGGIVTQRPSNRSRVEWLRIVRQGTKIKSYTSTNGSSWRLLYQVTFPGLADCIYVDMMAYSLSGSAEVEATFDQVSITGGGSSYVDNTTLPGSFTQLDTDIELGQAELNIFPNPSRGVSQLELNGFVDAPAQIWVRDAFGKVVRQIEIDAPAGMVLSLDLTALPAGIYLITAMQDQREVVTKKLVLQR